MENSEKLAIALKNNTQTLTQLFEEAGIEIWDNEKEYALFLIDNDKFQFITYITSDDSSFKGAFLSQNNAIFVDYIGEYKYQVLNFKDIVQDRINELERIESEVDIMSPISELFNSLTDIEIEQSIKNITGGLIK